MSQVSEINAILDGLGEGASFDQVEYALRDYEKATVLTVLADRSLAAGGGGGGSQPVTEREIVNGSNLEIADGGFESLTWDTHSSGDVLLDLTDPSAPEVIEAGVYAVSVAIQTPGGYPAGTNYDVELDLDYNDEFASLAQTVPGSANGAPSALSLTWYLAAGAVLNVSVTNYDVVPRIFKIAAAHIQRLSEPAV